MKTHSDSYATPLEAHAEADAEVASIKVGAALVPGLLEAVAGADLLKAEAKADASFIPTAEGEFAEAEASAAVGKVEAGISNVPFANVSAKVMEADADAGFGWKYTGASVGASLGEVKAGPLGARLGLKFGAGIRNGVPEIDLGPITI